MANPLTDEAKPEKGGLKCLKKQITLNTTNVQYVVWELSQRTTHKLNKKLVLIALKIEGVIKMLKKLKNKLKARKLRTTRNIERCDECCRKIKMKETLILDVSKNKFICRKCEK